MPDLIIDTAETLDEADSLLPIRDVIRVGVPGASLSGDLRQPHPRTALLWAGQTLRHPRAAIVLCALERGCTRPGCTAPAYWCQVHHVDGWAADHGETNIDKLTLACGPDNRLVEDGGWTTHKRKDGRTEWIPPPHLDTGQSRVNDFHHPEKYLVDRDDEDP